VILITGATGLVGSNLLRRLVAEDRDVRCMVRDPRRLGPNRVRVQITLGNVANPVSVKQAVRGVETVVHLAAAIRDQADASIEEVNGMGTARLLREGRRAGVRRFLFFSALGATPASRTRFFRTKALGERAVLDADRDGDFEGIVIAPSIIYAPGDPWLTLLARMALLPWMPVAGSGAARFQPIWAEDVAACVESVLDRPFAGHDGHGRLELAGPEIMSYEEIARLAMEAEGRRRPIVHVPLPLVRRGLRAIERVAGQAAFATWEEAELMEEPMTTARNGEDARLFGVEPKSMREVLGLERASNEAAP
jgi:uncharacterized protein YbjT (DUF2867 family)